MAETHSGAPAGIQPGTPPAKNRTPTQLIIMAAITLGLIGISMIKLFNPEYSETSKARKAVSYYLDALGKAPITKLGVELHPDLHKTLEVSSLTAYFKRTRLDRPVTLLDLNELDYDKAGNEWEWLAQVQAGQERFPLWVAIRQPSEQVIGRRWRVYALCRPDLDLPATAGQMLSARAQKPTPALTAARKDFQPAAGAHWQLIGTQPLTTVLQGQQGRSLILTWKAEANQALGCNYKLQHAQQHAGPAAPGKQPAARRPD